MSATIAYYEGFRNQHPRDLEIEITEGSSPNSLTFESDVFYWAIPFTINISCQNELSAVIVTVPLIVLVPFFIYTSIPFVSNLS